MKKKIVAMLLIACMSISAAACGKSEEPKEKVKTEAQKETKEKKEYQKIGVESAEAYYGNHSQDNSSDRISG